VVTVNPKHDSRDVAELLQATFETQGATPLDPSIIQLMLELAHTPDAALPDRKSPPPSARKPQLLHFLTGRFRRKPIRDRG